MNQYIGVVYFNNWLGNATVDAPEVLPAISRNRVAEHNPYVEGYRDGDELIRSRYVHAVEAENSEAAAEAVWAYFNRDDRCNGRSERSASVGDVIVVESDSEREAFSCQPVGMLPIPIPTWRVLVV